jgi:hypothetical protein
MDDWKLNEPWAVTTAEPPQSEFVPMDEPPSIRDLLANAAAIDRTIADSRGWISNAK